MPHPGTSPSPVAPREFTTQTDWRTILGVFVVAVPALIGLLRILIHLIL